MNDNPVQESAHPHSDHADDAPALNRRPRHWFYGVIVVVLLIGLLLLGWLPRYRRHRLVEARAVRERGALPIVQVVTAEEASSSQDLTLPGTVIPVMTTHIYSRATGYVRALKVDIGDTVHRDQVLAIVEAPDLDATVQQQHSLVQVSESQLDAARSQLALEQATYDRVHTLALHGVLSLQDDDVALAAVKAAGDAVQTAQNNVKAASAALEHWTVLASYEQVRSPIDGMVTARNINVGSLVSALGAGEGLSPNGSQPGSQSGGPITGGSQGGELFQITDMRNLRTYVNVPEEDAEFVRTGQEANLTFSELPTQQFRGRIIRSSNSLNQDTRTLLLEVQILDPEHRLRPGMFASVQLHFNAQEPGILISGDSVIPRAQGEFVALVQNNIVHLRQIQVGRDLGTQLYVTSGLENGDQVIVNPTDSVREGVRVQAEPAPKGQEK